MFGLIFFVFNLSPWPFLDRAQPSQEQLILSLYLVVEEILIKFYSVCQHAASYIWKARAYLLTSQNQSDPIFNLIRGAQVRIEATVNEATNNKKKMPKTRCEYLITRTIYSADCYVFFSSSFLRSEILLLFSQ